ncbi:MAG: methionyl-tRNA formyltransferase [Schleiferiaceae bacterium]|nr:methionyl-tRNA formyltransferase [Schleiferiaceae bacterium]
MLRTVFFGTPDFAATSLQALIHAPEINVVAVVSAPDRPSGRGQQLKSSPVALLAREHSITLLQPEKLRDPEFLTELAAFNADIFTVVAFRMLPEVVWNMPPYGSLNIHGSLLPDLRGAAPIQWSLAYGDSETGVTAFSLNHAIDEGPVLRQVRISVGTNETFGELYARMASEGAQLAAHVLVQRVYHDLRPLPQEEGLAHRAAPKLTPEFTHLEHLVRLWDVHNRIKACDPIPGASLPTPESPTERWKLFGSEWPESVALSSSKATHYIIDNQGIKIISADAHVIVHEVQWPGKRRMSATDFVRGSRLRGRFTLSGQKND